jgi:ribonucleoside-triphosphate reductase (formate)
MVPVILDKNPNYIKNKREFYQGMGQAVAERTILRKKKNGEWEDWGDVANRVALGNSLLCRTPEEQKYEYHILKKHISKAIVLMSGRHLQHGDKTQPERNMEVFCNCATSPTSFLLFYLLLNGSGVGRSYDDDIMMINWDNSPTVRCVLEENHADFDWSAHESVRDAKHKYGSGKDVLWFEVPDSREGWAKSLELWENAAFEKIHKDKMLILNFTEVRPKGSPIGGMQNRPSSGPVPLMNAFYKASTLKGAGLKPWQQSIYVDHYFAECVLVGGARRAARMSTKQWTDDSIFDFITIKRPVEYCHKSIEEIKDYRESCKEKPQSFLWSSNNSVAVDEKFWEYLDIKRGDSKYLDPAVKKARQVFKLITEASYGDGTGEPGIINVHHLAQNDDGWDDLKRGDYVGSSKYQINEDTEILMSRLARKTIKKKYHTIVNPCSEICLNILGGFCVIADLVPYFADTIDEAEEAIRTTVRALIRVNTMDSIYKKEVRRTNRIGVGLTGVHEFAWKFFGYGFRDLINEEKSKDFWMTLARFNRAVRDESIEYSKKLKLNIPHTVTTVKPSGTMSKLFGLTEGWHLPALTWYLRWVQFRSDDPLVEEYKAKGYPYRELVKYEGTTIIGFPTSPLITELKMGDALVTAGEATPEEQYKWLSLGEKYWINGVDENEDLIKEHYGNQISYTLKYIPEKVDYKQFKEMIHKYQSKIRCCSVMPQEKMAAYEYQPEEPVTKAEFENIRRQIEESLSEEVDKKHVDCENGHCPIDFKEKVLVSS